MNFVGELQTCFPRELGNPLELKNTSILNTKQGSSLLKEVLDVIIEANSTSK